MSEPRSENRHVSWTEYDRLRRACDENHRNLLRHAANLEAEVRRLQAWVSRLTEGEPLLCEDLCPVLCAGPCEGAESGSAVHLPSDGETDLDWWENRGGPE